MIDFRGVRTKRYTYALQKVAGHVQPYVLYDNQDDPYHWLKHGDHWQGVPIHGKTRSAESEN